MSSSLLPRSEGTRNGLREWPQRPPGGVEIVFPVIQMHFCSFSLILMTRTGSGGPRSVF